jgi:hypothetical protein
MVAPEKLSGEARGLTQRNGVFESGYDLLWSEGPAAITTVIVPVVAATETPAIATVAATTVTAAAAAEAPTTAAAAITFTVSGTAAPAAAATVAAAGDTYAHGIAVETNAVTADGAHPRVPTHQQVDSHMLHRMRQKRADDTLAKSRRARALAGVFCQRGHLSQQRLGLRPAYNPPAIRHPQHHLYRRRGHLNIEKFQ